MKTLPKITAAAGLLSLEVLLSGCAEEFPQYSGTYKLSSFSHSNPEFQGEQPPPKKMDLIDRMEHYGGIWIHHLKLDFAEPEAGRNIALRLNNLTNVDRGAWPNNGFNGANIFNEKKVYGTGAFCNYQYQYFLYLESNPSAEILREVYPGQAGFVGNDPTTGMPLYESLHNPKEVELDEAAAEKWQKTIDDNPGIILTFTFTRHLKSERPGWEDGYRDCILPYDPRGEESLTLIYQSDEENNTVDIRKAGLEDIYHDLVPAETFFTKLISGVKL